MYVTRNNVAVKLNYFRVYLNASRNLAVRNYSAKYSCDLAFVNMLEIKCVNVFPYAPRAR